MVYKYIAVFTFKDEVSSYEQLLLTAIGLHIFAEKFLIQTYMIMYFNTQDNVNKVTYAKCIYDSITSLHAVWGEICQIKFGRIKEPLERLGINARAS